MSWAVAEKEKSELSSPLLGTVLAVQANFYLVKMDLGLPIWDLELENITEKAAIFPSDQEYNHPKSPSEAKSSSERASEASEAGGAGEAGEAGGETVKFLNETLNETWCESNSIKSIADSKNPKLLCTRRARLKKIGQRVMVGDRVLIEEPDWVDGRGVIESVVPRQTELDRPPIANVKQIIIVFALEEPTLDPYQLSKFLVKAESTGLQVGLCLNKSDLVTKEERQNWQKRLGEWGYQPIFISVYDNIGLEELKDKLNRKITVLAGLSGVGKSSLINQLVPETNLRVGEVTGKLGRGRHTTRHVELFELANGSLLADTPGFNQPDLDCHPMDLINYFPEARYRLAIANCQFNDCLHQDEPNCAVRGDWERYQHYLDFLADAIARQERLNDRSDPESNLKAKVKGKGQTQYEPKLETKKYRRHSRRNQQQELEGLYREEEDF